MALLTALTHVTEIDEGIVDRRHVDQTDRRQAETEFWESSTATTRPSHDPTRSVEHKSSDTTRRDPMAPKAPPCVAGLKRHRWRESRQDVDETTIRVCRYCRCIRREWIETEPNGYETRVRVEYEPVMEGLPILTL